MEQEKKNSDTWAWIVILLAFPTLYFVLREEGHSRGYSNEFAAFVALFAGIHFSLNSTLSHMLDVFDKKDRLRITESVVKICIAAILAFISYYYFGTKGTLILILPIAFMVYNFIGRIFSRWWKKVTSEEGT